jgi:DNA-directed RNA polymerase subunit L
VSEKLSDRVRPDVEAARWVVDEIKVLERELAEARKQLEDFEVEATNAINDIVRVKYQRDTLAEALETVLDEVRNDYMACKDEVKAALAAVKGGSYE